MILDKAQPTFRWTLPAIKSGLSPLVQPSVILKPRPYAFPKIISSSCHASRFTFLPAVNVLPHRHVPGTPFTCEPRHEQTPAPSLVFHFVTMQSTSPVYFRLACPIHEEGTLFPSASSSAFHSKLSLNTNIL